MLSILTALLCLALLLSQKSWAQTGILPKPSIWVVPGAVVPQGTSATILCSGPPGVTRYRLEQGGSSQVWYEENPQGFHKEANFFFPLVTSSHAGSYTCQYEKLTWSEHSNPLELVVAGVHKETPVLSAHPGPMVPLRGNVILLCHSRMHYNTFVLSKDVGEISSAAYSNQSFGKFLISPMTRAHGGIYRCYGFNNTSPYEWSPPSDALELLVTGVYQAPSISVQPNSALTSPASKSLMCFSMNWFDDFLLSKEGDTSPPQRLRSQYKAGMFQANFPLSPGSLAHGGTYRCYGSLSTFSYLWSSPSEPLVQEGRGSIPWDHTTENIIRLGLAGVFLLVLGGLLLEAWLSRKNTQKPANRPPF